MIPSQTYFRISVIDFTKVLSAIFFIIFFIILLFDTLELIRSTSKYSFQFRMIVKLALMKNYGSLEKIIPIIALISSALYFYIKNKSNEIMTAKSYGLSNANIIAPVIFVIVIFGILNITVFNPVGKMLLKKYQNYEAQNFKKQSSLVSVSKNGIWLKNKLDDKDVIISALRVSEAYKTLYDTNVFFFDKDFQFRERMIAKSIVFKKEELILRDVISINSKFQIKNIDKVILPIKISMSQIFGNLTSIEGISFFQLLEFIKLTEDSGVSATRYKLYFFKELFSPFFIMGMVFISYFFCSKLGEKKKFDVSIFYSILVGFSIYFFANFMHAIGESGKISIILSVIFPIIVSNLVPIYLIINKNN
ncbi:MAG: lipopolysaccharide export system permease protein [Candidatus Midichloriaceae bacterium]|jgi:lipopolysaccharide export system permease protein